MLLASCEVTNITRRSLRTATDQMMACLWQHSHILLQLSFFVALLSGLRADSLEWRQTGEDIEVTCSTDLQNQDGMYVYHTYAETRQVFYLTPGMKCSPRLPWDQRVKISGLFTNFKVTIRNLTLEDTGVFWCQYLKFEGSKQHPSKSKNTSVLVVVNGVTTGMTTVNPCPTHAQPESPEEPMQMSALLTVAIITAFSLILLILIIMLIWVKRCCGENGKYKPRPQPSGGLPSHRSDSVYEQMRPQRATSLSHSSQSSAQVLLNPAYAGQSYPQSIHYP